MCVRGAGGGVKCSQTAQNLLSSHLLFALLSMSHLSLDGWLIRESPILKEEAKPLVYRAKS